MPAPVPDIRETFRGYLASNYCCDEFPLAIEAQICYPCGPINVKPDSELRRAMAECIQAEAQAERVTHNPPSVVFVRPKQAKLLHSRLARIVRTALEESETVVARLAAAGSAEKFLALRKEVFPDYVNLAYIIANSFSMVDDRLVRLEALKQAFKAVEQVFQSEVSRRLGKEEAGEAFFCLDTLRRAYGLVHTIRTSGEALEGSAKESDQKLMADFNFAALWSQLHLDCLRFIITTGRTRRNKEVVEEILQGARVAVMAYSYARQGVALRTKPEAYVRDDVQDDEDREILEESYLDYVDNESKLDAESSES